ncbi:hypothetical protein DFH08DRAFT_816934 [Mycena albidolilacea]|uniref:Uncharacterized protein n=1 Tax=Mycena albidolilacea TaxID=1033008 RepID=A0AAD6ZJ70_9AGAR|nr:hypothetical protein DFH08DRAFT_816934 [Mycena albidolilacea]
MVVPATIDNTLRFTVRLGALFIVVIITSILYGGAITKMRYEDSDTEKQTKAGLIQCWIYFQNKPKGDHWSLALLVASVTILDTVQQGLICHAVYGYAVTGHGDPTSMLKMQKCVHRPVSNLPIHKAQYRTIMIELFFGGALALSVILLANLEISNIWMDFESLAELIKQKRLATTLNIFGAVSDLVITVIMLIFMACSTGIPTTLCSIADVICPHNKYFQWTVHRVLTPAVYTNCLLVTFNARDYIRNGANGFSSMEMTVTMPEVAILHLASNPGDEERDIDVRGSKFV